ncbi:MAG: aminopeptidase [bacterium]
MALSFEQSLERYADVVVRIGVGLQKGQRLVVRASVETAPFTRAAVAAAYRAGARMVDVLWTDDQVDLARFRLAPRDSFDEFPTAVPNALLASGERGDAVLSVYATDPTLLKDQDPELVAKTDKARQTYLMPFSKKISGKEVNWCVASAPIPSWAGQVFPDLSAEAAVRKLWEEIFRTCRIDRPDPVAAWETHIADLARRREQLDRKQYAALRFRSPGTDLTVGLPDRHHWLGGRSDTVRTNIPFVANLPTEEVFTTPHKDRVDGVVRATKPLAHAGKLVEGFELRFEKGRVTSIKAEKNQAVLEKLVETDEGAHRLGEVALVPHGSPISKSGILFFNTLFDENASCHVALGRSYRICVVGGENMNDEEFARAGGNDSLAHVDFMIGSAQTDIDAVAKDGKVEPLMRAGEWVTSAVAATA